MHDLWSWLQSAKGELFQAGFAGAMVSAAMEWTGILPAVRKIVVGTLCAMYLSPITAPVFAWAFGGLSIPQENAVGVSGFLMGVVGIIFIEIVLKVFTFKRDTIGRKRDD